MNDKLLLFAEKNDQECISHGDVTTCKTKEDYIDGSQKCLTWFTDAYAQSELKPTRMWG